MKPIKTLLICYYWPPTSGGGVMRWLKMSKYWNDECNELIVYTPELVEFPAYDETLLAQVPKNVKIIKNKIWEPYKIYKRFTGKKNTYSGFINEKEKSNWKDKLSVWIRSNFFIPDARTFWIKPSIKYLYSYLKENPIDVIISTGPPHSMHLIALGLKKKLNIKWIADFRDPWTDIDYADELKLTDFAQKKHEKLERQVLENADKVVTVSWSWQKDLGALGSRTDIELITNGFDPADFIDCDSTYNEKFSICHLGSMNSKRNPENLWEVISALCLENQEFKQHLEIKLIGQVDASIIKSIENLDLNSYLQKIDFLPHKNGLMELNSSSILLLPINLKAHSEGIIPGKVYEYLATGKPILAIGSKDSDIKYIIENSKNAILLDYQDSAEMKSFIWNEFINFKSNSATNKTEANNQYSRKELANRYKQLVKNLTQKI